MFIGSDALKLSFEGAELPLNETTQMNSAPSNGEKSSWIRDSINISLLRNEDYPRRNKNSTRLKSVVSC
jgi:hypothetical protein